LSARWLEKSPRTVHTSTATGVTSRDFGSEIYVTRRVDQVQHVVQSIMIVQHGTCLGLDGNASFSLDIELVQNLSISTFFNDTSEFEQAVAQGTLSMVDVSDDAEVAEAVYGDGGDTFLEFGLHLSDLGQSRGSRVEEAGMIDEGRIDVARSEASRKGAKEASLHLVLRSACPGLSSSWV